MFRVEREWKDGDVVTLNFNFKLRTETRKSNAVAIAWGPLYFVLRIGEAFENIPRLPYSANPGRSRCLRDASTGTSRL